MKTKRLTKWQKAAMREVIEGADIYNRSIAMRLREVETSHPEFIRITAARTAPRDGAQQQPYFGAILTLRGIEAISIRKAQRSAARHEIEVRA